MQPFVVQTTAQTVNGVSVPAGVYMDAAYINNVTALWGRFGTLVADTIQATAISASQLTLGDGTVGGTLKSSNFVTGSAGWRLQPNGTAEFSGVVVRGTVYATAGTIGGWTIGSNYIRSSNWATGSTGVSLGSDGTVEIRNADNSRVIYLQATGTAAALKFPGLEILGNGTATFSGILNVKSASSGQRVEMTNSLITGYWANGNMSFRLGVW